MPLASTERNPTPLKARCLWLARDRRDRSLDAFFAYLKPINARLEAPKRTAVNEMNPSSSFAAAGLVPRDGAEHLQLVVAHGQTVLFNSQTKQLSVIAPRARNVPTRCPYCYQPMNSPPNSPPSSEQQSPNSAVVVKSQSLSVAAQVRQSGAVTTAQRLFRHRPFIQDSSSIDYFDVLSQSVQATPANTRPGTPVGESPDSELHHDSFVQGYYNRFFVEERKLGRGARGTVYLCSHVLESNVLGHYAVKKITVGNSIKSLMATLQEVKHLEHLRHPHIVAYHHSWLEMHRANEFQPEIPHLFLLMAFANGGSLENFIALRRNAIQAHSNESAKRLFKSRRSKESSIDDPSKAAIHYLRVDEILSLFKDIAAGLEFLHANDVLHLDLKAENVLLHFHDTDSPVPVAMLSDFGSSETSYLARSRDRSGFTGTIGYVAPEVFQLDPRTGRYPQLTPSADLWALGLLLHLLCYFRLPFEQEEDLDLLKREIENYRGFVSAKHPRFDIPNGLEMLMARLINRRPSNRPAAAQVLQALNTLHVHQTPMNSVLVRRSSSPTVGRAAAAMDRRVVRAIRALPFNMPPPVLLHRFASGLSILGKLRLFGVTSAVLVLSLLEILWQHPLASIASAIICAVCFAETPLDSIACCTVSLPLVLLYLHEIRIG